MRFKHFVIQTMSFYLMHTKPASLASEAAQYNYTTASYMLEGCSISFEATSVAFYADSLALEAATLVKPSSLF